MWQLDPENVEALVALGVMDLNTNEREFNAEPSCFVIVEMIDY